MMANSHTANKAAEDSELAAEAAAAEASAEKRQELMFYADDDSRSDRSSRSGMSSRSDRSSTSAAALDQARQMAQISSMLETLLVQNVANVPASEKTEVLLAISDMNANLNVVAKRVEFLENQTLRKMSFTDVFADWQSIPAQFRQMYREGLRGLAIKAPLKVAKLAYSSFDFIVIKSIQTTVDAAINPIRFFAGLIFIVVIGMFVYDMSVKAGEMSPALRDAAVSALKTITTGPAATFVNAGYDRASGLAQYGWEHSSEVRDSTLGALNTARKWAVKGIADVILPGIWRSMPKPSLKSFW
jgi:hypothetical protein